jgi:hypothetical protein
MPLAIEDSYGQSSGAKGPGGPEIEVGGAGAFFKLTGAQKAPSGVYIFLQVQVRNPSGQLVAYVEGQPDVFDVQGTVNWVEPQSVKSTIIKKGQTLELMQFVHHMSYSRFDSLSAYFVRGATNGDPVTIMFFNNDSIPVTTGDQVDVFWTVIRPL